MVMYTYDVFISCKSEDYGLAKNVYTFLVKQGYCVFLADAELRKIGNAEYGKIIDVALDSAKHFILVTSRREFAESSYVESEWRTFIEEKRAGRKRGNLLTILKGMDVSLLPISLRQFQSFSYSNFYNIINYLQTFQPTNEENKSIESDSKLKELIKFFGKYLLISCFCLLTILFVFFYVVCCWEESNEEELEPSIRLENTRKGENEGTKDGEYVEVKTNKSSKEEYLNALWSAYQECKDTLKPAEFYDKVIKDSPRISEDISKEEFLKYCFLL